ncbi:MAG TPA: hypothetical protein VH054_15950, partial [Polyangiaceae bacterium]|nr:hypothetical protein [Polyangiaceae bacterium]
RMLAAACAGTGLRTAAVSAFIATFVFESTLPLFRALPAFAADLVAAFGFVLVLARVVTFGAFDAGLTAGRALPAARFFCAALEDFVDLAIGVPR